MKNHQELKRAVVFELKSFFNENQRELKRAAFIELKIFKVAITLKKSPGARTCRLYHGERSRSNVVSEGRARSRGRGFYVHLHTDAVGTLVI